MRHTLRIQLRTSEGAVIRALGLIERRGFRLETVHATEAQGDGQTMTVTVSGDRPVDLLRRQLERLHDLIWVDVAGAAEGAEPRQGASRWTPSTSHATKGAAERRTATGRS